MDLIPFSLSGQCLEGYFVKINARSKIIYWIIILMIVAGIIILPFIYVDVSVQARGFFQSDIEKQTVLAPYQGKILYSSVHNGNHVKRGDTLLVIDSESLKAQHSALLKRIAENNSSISDLVNLTSGDYSEDNNTVLQLINSRYQAEFENLKSQHEIQYQKYQKKKTEHERTIFLYNQKIVPDLDYENSVYSLNSEKDHLSQILINQRSIWQSDLMIRRIDSINLMADLKQFREELANRIVIAPVSGEIIKSADIQPGSIVNPGQMIAEISPDGELMATCFVQPADIGLIHENQKVRIQVDAFNYTEWGMLQGNIVDISDDMIVENGSIAYFRVKCRPEKTFLSLKNGLSADVKKGMSINTRIVVIRRSLFNLLFDKADKWFNPYTYKKE